MTPNELIKVINKSLNVDITRETRQRKTVYARFIFYNKLRHTKDKYYSFQMIGNFLNKNHATVIHGLKQFELLKDYEDFKELIDKVEAEIENSGGYATNRLTKLLTNHFEIRRYNEKRTIKAIS